MHVPAETSGFSRAEPSVQVPRGPAGNPPRYRLVRTGRRTIAGTAAGPLGRREGCPRGAGPARSRAGGVGGEREGRPWLLPPRSRGLAGAPSALARSEGRAHVGLPGQAKRPNTLFNRSPRAASVRPSNDPALIRSAAASMAPQATRARAPPTLTRRTPSSAIS